jgi:hypothetical protein
MQSSGKSAFFSSFFFDTVEHLLFLRSRSLDNTKDFGEVGERLKPPVC